MGLIAIGRWSPRGFRRCTFRASRVQGADFAKSVHLSASLHTCHGLDRPRWNLGHSPWRVFRCWILHTVSESPSTFASYGAVSTFRRVRAALWPARFPVYASAMLFPHPSASRSASGFVLLTRCLPRSSNGLANMSATLGSFYWLGFETSGLSPDKKRLALLGAQR